MPVFFIYQRLLQQARETSVNVDHLPTITMTVAYLIFYTGTHYFVSQCRWFTKIWILKIAIDLPTEENDVNSTYALVLP